MLFMAEAVKSRIDNREWVEQVQGFVYPEPKGFVADEDSYVSRILRNEMEIERKWVGKCSK